MSGVVIGRSCGNSNRFGNCAYGTRESDGFLNVEALRNETGADAEFFGGLDFMNEIPRRFWCAGKGVET
jgi:hypothetical protein